MKELTIAQREVSDEQGVIHTYHYSILVGEMEVSDGFPCESYGVGVREQNGEQCEIPNITASASRIDELAELLVRNTVTPCTLRDVVADWL